MSRFAPSRALVFQLTERGRLAALLSMSHTPTEIDLGAIPVLGAFVGGATPAEALETLRGAWDTDAADFDATVHELVAAGLLTRRDGGGAPGPLGEVGFASVMRHHHMLRDTLRVLTYKAAIQRHVAGKSVVEIGCGSGVLSILAAQAGARRVTAIEETRIAELAREMFAANGVEVELREGNSRDVELAERADVVLHEIIGLDPLDEGILQTIADARRRFLAPGGRMLPGRLQICVAAYAVPDEPRYDRLRALDDAREYAGLYGVDFGPLLARLEALPSRAFGGPAIELPRNPLRTPSVFPAEILSEEAVIYDLDFGRDGFERPGETRARLRFRRPGLAGGVLVYFRASLDERLQLSNGPFVPTTTWGWDARALSRVRRVGEGDELTVAARVATVAGRQRVIVDEA